MPLEHVDLRRTKVIDIAPVVNAELKNLLLDGSPVTDLSPLKNAPSIHVTLGNDQAAHLETLAGAKLKSIWLEGADFKDLAPLQDMPLNHVWLHETSVTDLSPLKGAPLTMLEMRNTPVTDLMPLRGMKSLAQLYLYAPGVDLTPLAGLPLETIRIPDPATVSNIEVLRGIKSLKHIKVIVRAFGDRLTMDRYLLDLKHSRGDVVHIRLAQELLQAAEAEMTRSLDANTNAPNTVSRVKIETIRLAAEKAALQVKQAKLVHVLASLARNQVLARHLGKDMSAESFWRRYDEGAYAE